MAMRFVDVNGSELPKKRKWGIIIVETCLDWLKWTLVILLIVLIVVWVQR